MATTAEIAKNRKRVAKQFTLPPGMLEEGFAELSYPEKQERMALYKQAAESTNLGDLFTDVSFDQAVRELSDEERRDLQGEFDWINKDQDDPGYQPLSIEEFEQAQGQARSDWKHLNPTPEEETAEQIAQLPPLDEMPPKDFSVDKLEKDAQELEKIESLKRDPVVGHGASVMRPPEPSMYVEEADRYISPTGEYLTSEDEIVEYQKPGWGVEKAVAQSIAEALMPPGVAQAYDLAYLANETEKFSRGEAGWSAPATAIIAFLPLGDLLKIPGRVGAAMRRALRNNPSDPTRARREAMQNLHEELAVPNGADPTEVTKGFDKVGEKNWDAVRAEDQKYIDDHPFTEEWEAANPLEGAGTLGEKGARIRAGKEKVLDQRDIEEARALGTDATLDIKELRNKAAADAIQEEKDRIAGVMKRGEETRLNKIEEAQDAATDNMAAIKKAGAARQKATKDNTAWLEQQAREADREVAAAERASARGETPVSRRPGSPTRQPLVGRTSTEPAVTKPKETGLAVPDDASLATMSPKERSLAVSAKQFTEEPARQATVTSVIEPDLGGRPQLQGPAGQAPPDVTPAADLPPRPRRSDELASFEQGAAAHLEQGRRPKPAAEGKSVDDLVREAMAARVKRERERVAAKHTPETEEPFPDWEDAPVSDDVASAPGSLLMPGREPDWPKAKADVPDAAATKAAADKAAAAAAATKRADKRRAAGKYDSTDFEEVGVGEIKEKTVVNFRNSEGMFNPDDVSTVIRVQKTKKGDVLTIKDADGNKVQLYASEVRALKPGRDLPQSAADAAEEALTARDILGRAFKKRRIGPRTRAVAGVGVAGTGTVAGGVTLWNRHQDKKERTAMYDGLSTEFGMAPSLKYLPGYSNPFYSGEGEETTPKPMGALLEELLDERDTELTRDVVAKAAYEDFDNYIQDGDESKRFREMVGKERLTVVDLIQMVELLQSPELAEDKLTPAQKNKKKKWENEVRRTLRGFYTYDAKQKARIGKQEEGG